MADHTTTQTPDDAPKVQEVPARPTEALAKPATSTIDSDNISKADAAAEEPKLSSIPTAPTTSEEITSTTEKMEDTGADGETAARTEPVSNGTPASSKKGSGKRKSGPGVPEHKKKTLNRKKSMPELRLNVEPGDYWFVAMRGFPPWPVIVCDEDMLPESLLSKRPVSAKRIDGTYREDFLEGGKNAKDRRYPIMFLGTNEFAWQVNTDLQPLDVEEVKQAVKENNQGKKTKALWEAYHVAAEEHDLQWFKAMLLEHDKAIAADIEEKAAAEAKKQEKKEKSRRKSTAVEENEDIEMNDVDEDGDLPPTKAKASKKRKKDTDSDGETEKQPAKTPKTKLKITNKTPKDDSAAKPKKASKPKKAKAKGESEEETETPKVEEKTMTEAEVKEKREKGVLYLRHRLQKGFLTRDQTPKEEEMANMSDYFKQLEQYADLEAEIIRKTKIHKVLRAIIKLNSIPKEEDYQFKKRSNDLLNGWNRALAADVETAAAVEGPGADQGVPTTNGVNHEEKVEEKHEEANASEAPAPADDPEDTPADPETSKEVDGKGDVSMAEAKDDNPAVKVAEAALEATVTA
ncbi:hypothetical protein K432DRAFT_162271 [Lepidopterella palustris CBS 459.81]|uniref:PWWP domain-containing protein n=1 Tax=Lepidopterella palustris CBS 459.81 TaxID=1314670 RepID=A0A8E2EH22_9PEZI|nr:hypothetical protein K432DRAFT_162271 [Lepidopterella palustris CBS 459.81]